MPSFYVGLLFLSFLTTVTPMKGGLRIRETEWQRGGPPGGGSRSVMLNADVCMAEECSYVGECGVEVLPIGFDGLIGGNDVRQRAILSGSLFVHHNYRRQGVAQRLLREAENRVRLWGLPELLLTVKKQNTAARTLYEKMGYRCVPHTKHHGDQICMRRNLFVPDLQTLISVLPKHTVVDSAVSKTSSL